MQKPRPKQLSRRSRTARVKNNRFKNILRKSPQYRCGDFLSVSLGYTGEIVNFIVAYGNGAYLLKRKDMRKNILVFFKKRIIIKSMKGTVRNLSNYIRALPLKDGKNEIFVPYLSIYCNKAEMVPMSMVKSQYLYYIAEGSIRLHTPSGIMDYVAGQASVSSIDTPFCGEVLTTSADGEFIALIVEFTEEEVISVALSLEGDLTERIANGKISQQTGSKAEKSITDCLLRLLKCCFEEDIRAFMAAQIKRKTCFMRCCLRMDSTFCKASLKSAERGKFMRSIVGSI